MEKNPEDKNPKNYCDICDKTIKGSSYKFKAHLYQQHKAVSSRFKCSFCSKEYFRTDMFIRHMSRHTGENQNKKSYTCDHCDRSFAEKRNLIIHLKIHDDYGSMKYKCMACGVVYCEERLLKYHIRKSHFNLHESETEHVKKELNETWVEQVKESEVCVQMTKINNNVLSIKKFGMTTYNTEHLKPDSIDEKAKFKEYMSSVFAHKDRSQYSKATCDYCQKEMLKKSLLSHIRERHLKLKRFKCDECSVQFSRHYQLVDHVCGKTRNRRSRKSDKGNFGKVGKVK